MHVTHLSLHDFRSYAELELDLEPGAREPLSISQPVRDFSPRPHNTGFHKVELTANGKTVAEGGFELAV